MWSELTWFVLKWFCSEVKWSEVSYVEVLGDKSTMHIRATIYWGYLIVLWLFYLVCILYCGCFNWFCNVWVCVQPVTNCFKCESKWCILLLCCYCVVWKNYHSISLNWTYVQSASRIVWTVQLPVHHICLHVPLSMVQHCSTMCGRSLSLSLYIYIYICIQGVPGGMCQTSGECSLS